MAEMNVINRTKLQRCVRRSKKHTIHVDMTPMSDLGFLHVAFFVFTVELYKPMVSDLYMPAEGQHMNIGESNSLTVLLAGNDRLFYYYGNLEDGIRKKEIFETGYSYNNGIGKIIRDKQNFLESKNTGKHHIMLIIKADKKSIYRNMVDILDEILINAVKKYAFINISGQEAMYLESISAQ